MFNDILTGKATLDPPHEPATPYRTPAELPPVRHACVACSQHYDAPNGSPPGRCPACFVAMVVGNSAQSAQQIRDFELQQQKERRNAKLLRFGLLAAVGLAVAFVKVQMTQEANDTAAKAAGYRDYSDYKATRDAVYPTDAFSYHVHGLAEQMCACKDLACGRDTLAQFRHFIQTGEPSDDKASASVAQDTRRLYECEAPLEH